MFQIWNYEEKRLEISAKFGDVPYSVALHPSGLHLLVGFEDKLRYMNLHMDELKVVKEFAVKQCREVRFSNGGQMFAAAYHSNILVFNSYTGEQCAILKGHNGRVQQLVWLADDTRLMSTGADGAVYQVCFPSAPPVFPIGFVLTLYFSQWCSGTWKNPSACGSLCKKASTTRQRPCPERAIRFMWLALIRS